MKDVIIDCYYYNVSNPCALFFPILDNKLIRNVNLNKHALVIFNFLWRLSSMLVRVISNVLKSHLLFNFFSLGSRANPNFLAGKYIGSFFVTVLHGLFFVFF